MHGAIQPEQQMLVTLLDQIPCVVMVLNKGSGAIIYSNAAARRAGWDVGKPCYEALAASEPNSVEIGFGDRRYEGTRRDLDDESCLLYLFDITDRGCASANERAEPSSPEDRLPVAKQVGSIAHDLRNQLTIIKGFSEILLRRNVVRPEGEDNLLEVLKAAEKSTLLTEQLLNLSRKSAD